MCNELISGKTQNSRSHKLPQDHAQIQPICAPGYRCCKQQHVRPQPALSFSRSLKKDIQIPNTLDPKKSFLNRSVDACAKGIKKDHRNCNKLHLAQDAGLQLSRNLRSQGAQYPLILDSLRPVAIHRKSCTSTDAATDPREQNDPTGIVIPSRNKKHPQPPNNKYGPNI